MFKSNFSLLKRIILSKEEILGKKYLVYKSFRYFGKHFAPTVILPYNQVIVPGYFILSNVRIFTPVVQVGHMTKFTKDRPFLNPKYILTVLVPIMDALD